MGWADRYPNQVPSRATIDAALAERQQRDADYGTGTLWTEAVADDEGRAIGHVAEAFVKAWLRWHQQRWGFHFQHHGGVDGLPDLEIEGVGVGVRCHHKSRIPPPQVNLWPQDIQRLGTDQRLFIVAPELSGPYYILGGIPTADFAQHSAFVKTGQRPFPKAAPAQRDGYFLSAEALIPADEWLRPIALTWKFPQSRWATLDSGR